MGNQQFFCLPLSHKKSFDKSAYVDLLIAPDSSVLPATGYSQKNVCHYVIVAKDSGASINDLIY